MVRRTLAGPVETLTDEGVVPSAEVLATLVPQIAAATTASAYPDGSLQHLMALCVHLPVVGSWSLANWLVLGGRAPLSAVPELAWTRAVFLSNVTQALEAMTLSNRCQPARPETDQPPA